MLLLYSTVTFYILLQTRHVCHTATMNACNQAVSIKIGLVELQSFCCQLLPWRLSRTNSLWTTPSGSAKKNMLMKHHSFRPPETFYLSDVSASFPLERHSGEISLCTVKGFRTSCAFLLSFNDSVAPLMLRPLCETWHCHRQQRQRTSSSLKTRPVDH